MLTNTFCHIPRVGQRLEAQLWAHGIHAWQDVPAQPDVPGTRLHVPQFARHLEASHEALARHDACFFADALPGHLAWRLYPEFAPDIAYLDIETTGMTGTHDHVTTISLFDGHAIHYYVKGLNLERFLDDVQRYRVLVTYNGRQFDIPYLERFFKVKLPQAQIDLRFVLHRLGYKGGLKSCEHQCGIGRGDLEGVDGFFAVLLWRDFICHRNQAALETLLAYNMADTVNLATLLALAYNEYVRQTPFAATRRVPLPARPALPFKPHAETIARLRRLNLHDRTSGE